MPVINKINNKETHEEKSIYDNYSINNTNNFNSEYNLQIEGSFFSKDTREYNSKEDFMSVENSSNYARTPCRSSNRGISQLWDSGLGSPTPGSSPMKSKNKFDMFTNSKSPSLSPIPFSFEDNNEEANSIIKFSNNSNIDNKSLSSNNNAYNSYTFEKQLSLNNLSHSHKEKSFEYCSNANDNFNNHKSSAVYSGYSTLMQTPMIEPMVSIAYNRNSQSNQATRGLSTKLQYSMRGMRLNESPRHVLNDVISEEDILDYKNSTCFNSSNNRVRGIVNKSDNLKSKFHHGRFIKSKELFSEIKEQKNKNSNINPFISFEDYTRAAIKVGTKRCRDRLNIDNPPALDCSFEEHPHKKVALRDMNTSRFKEEFQILGTLGNGQFGSVYKCINRLDGCVYAIKRSKKPIAGSLSESGAVNEVYAHAVLGKHPHIVGYYSSWVEMDRIYIQNEFCNGGSLSDMLVQMRLENRQATENDMTQLLIQLADGLAFIHSHDLVHLDLKPDNVLFCIKLKPTTMEDSGHGEDLTAELQEFDFLYKIGDFGMVTSVQHPTLNEGDCRYLPKEILQESTSDIQKADIFSLSLTVFEMGTGIEMPPNGPLWHEYRVVGLPSLKNISQQFNSILKMMSSSDPLMRPTANEVIRRVNNSSPMLKSNTQLSRELLEQRRENEKLKKQLENLLTDKRQPPAQINTRLIGKFCLRSQSML